MIELEIGFDGGKTYKPVGTVSDFNPIVRRTRKFSNFQLSLKPAEPKPRKVRQTPPFWSAYK